MSVFSSHNAIESVQSGYTIIVAYTHRSPLQVVRAAARVNVRSRGPQVTWDSGFADTGHKSPNWLDWTAMGLFQDENARPSQH
jgi:hypothetical protein